MRKDKGIGQTPLEKSAELEEKRLKVYYGIGIKIALILFLTCIPLTIFGFRWKATNYEYQDVSYDWDDDNDRYDVYIDDIGRLFIQTDKATPIFLPWDESKNLAVVQKRETILGQLVTYELIKFFINFGAKEGNE